jgi:hypothetical protein
MYFPSSSSSSFDLLAADGTGCFRGVFVLRSLSADVLDDDDRERLDLEDCGDAKC